MMTSAELLAINTRVATYGIEPELPSPPAGGEEDLDVFSAADLAENEQTCEVYRMPGGKRLWVHPVSLEEALWINTQAMRETNQVDTRDQAEINLQIRVRAQVWQAQVCCRVGPETNAQRIFAPEDAVRLRKSPRFLTAIQEIAAISDRLSQGASEAEGLREGLRGFFERVANLLETLRGLSSITEPTCSPEAAMALADCETSVSCMRRLLECSPESR